MACFWNSIIDRLNKDEYFKKINNNIKLIPEHLILSLKENNRKTNNVIWQNNELTDKQKEENFQHIKLYYVKDIYNGYYCSTFDPFLFLICVLGDNDCIFTGALPSKSLIFKSLKLETSILPEVNSFKFGSVLTAIFKN